MQRKMENPAKDLTSSPCMSWHWLLAWAGVMSKGKSPHAALFHQTVSAMPKSEKPEKPVLHFASARDWQDWLVENTGSEAVWLKISKSQSTHPSVSYPEAVDIALCYGWIDGQKDKLDQIFWLQRFSRRTRKSPWSQINRDKVERLIASGQMTALGLAEVEAAKADGRWERAYASGREMKVPDDFLAALELNEKALSFFKTLNRQNQFAIAYRLQDAKRPETRLKRFQTYMDMMEKGEKLYP